MAIFEREPRRYRDNLMPYPDFVRASSGLVWPEVCTHRSVLCAEDRSGKCLECHAILSEQTITRLFPYAFDAPFPANATHWMDHAWSPREAAQGKAVSIPIHYGAWFTEPP